MMAIYDFRDVDETVETEKCESCGLQLPIEEMRLTDDGVWLCREAWDELVTAEKREGSMIWPPFIYRYRS